MLEAEKFQSLEQRKPGFGRMGAGGRCGYSITMVSLHVTSSHLYLVAKMKIPCIPKGLEDNKSKVIG